MPLVFGPLALAARGILPTGPPSAKRATAAGCHRKEKVSRVARKPLCNTAVRPAADSGHFLVDWPEYFASGRLAESSNKSEFAERGRWQISTEVRPKLQPTGRFRKGLVANVKTVVQGLLTRTPPSFQTGGLDPLRNYHNPSTSPYRSSDCRFRKMGPQCKCPSRINSANCCGDLSRIRAP